MNKNSKNIIHTIPEKELKLLITEIWNFWKKLSSKKEKDDPSQLHLFDPELNPISTLPSKERKERLLKSRNPSPNILSTMTNEEEQALLNSPANTLPTYFKKYWLYFYRIYHGKIIENTSEAHKVIRGGPPFFQNTEKWYYANFKGGIKPRGFEDTFTGRVEYNPLGYGHAENDPIIYIGPDLSDTGFEINYQKIKPNEKVDADISLMEEARLYMSRWNYSLAVKLGLVKW